MLIGRSRSPEIPTLGEWVWTGTPDPDLRGDARAARRNRVAGALRAGHGAGAAFDICVTSGPTPELSLVCGTPTAARWVARVLVPAYGRACWTRVPPSVREGKEGVEWGRRVRPWPDRFREPADGLAATSQLLLSMAGLPIGTWLRWSFFPSEVSWRRAGDREPFAEGSRVSSGKYPIEPGRARPPADHRPAEPVVPLFWTSRAVLGFPAGVTQDPDARARIRAAVEGALRSGRANGVRFSPRHRLAFATGRWFAVSEEELVLTLPDAETAGASSQRVSGSRQSILPLGRSDEGVVIGPGVEPGQGRHLAVLGETGMGKSATLVAVGHTAMRLGGVVLFDPLGETAQGFVQGLSPEERKERLLWVSPSRGSATINALEGVARPAGDPVLADRRLDDLVHALRRVRSGRYDSKYWGPRLEEMLTRALAAAATLPEGTFVDAHTLLASGGRTRLVAPWEARESVRDLTERIRDRPEDAEGARRLLYEVVRSPVLTRMLSSRQPTLHTGELVEPGRVAVISGDAAVVGESVARYLLSVYLALVWSELLARPIGSKTFVLLDESQWFAHESLAEMLRLARRRNVHVILATQTVSSLPEEVGEAVWTNVSDFVAFRGSPEEARELSRATHRVSAEEILSLPRGHAAVLLGKGNSVAWVRTVGRPSSTDPGRRESETESGGPRVPAQPAGPPSDRRSRDPEVVLGWLRLRARTVTQGGRLTVALSELRETVDPDGKAIRAAGTLLSRSGALLHSNRQESGSVWTLDPERIPPGPAATAGTSPPGDAEDAQPS